MAGTDFASMSEQELGQKINSTFERAKKYEQQPGSTVQFPKQLWDEIEGTVAGLCQRVGIEVPALYGGQSAQAH